MVTVADIAKQAFDAVAAGITDAILPATLNGSDAGRVVLGGETAPNGFPIAEVKDKTREAYLEGFASPAMIGDTLEAGGATYHVMSVRDIVQAGCFVVARVISEADMMWQEATFERLTRSSDGAGGYTEAWAAIAGLDGVQVGVMGLSGSERWASERIEATSKWRVWVNTGVAVTEVDKLVMGGRSYNIRFVNDIEKRGLWSVFDLDGGVAV